LGKLDELIKIHASNEVGVLSFQQLRKEIPSKNQRVLSPTGDLSVAAQNLFSSLRELDGLNVQFILAEEVPDTGLGRAINDRLRRASVQ
jgi:L-threonylcarbamoyladenylate synthase